MSPPCFPRALTVHNLRVPGDQLDVPLEDATLLEEVELISALMIAASEADGRLDPGRIDQLLGVPPPTAAEHGEARGT